MEVGGHIPDEVDGAGDVTSEAAEGLEASHGDETLAPKADAVVLSSTNYTIVRGVDDAAYGDMDSESFPPESPQQPDAEDGEVVSCDNGSHSAGGTAASSLSPASDWEMLDEEGRVSPTDEVTMARTGLDNDSDDIEQSGKATERMEAIAEAIVKDALEGALIRSATYEHAVILQEEDGEEDEIVGEERVDGLDAAMTEVSDEMQDSQYSDDIQPEYPGAYEYTAGDEEEGYTERISPANGDSSPYDDVGGVVEPDDLRIELEHQPFICTMPPRDTQQQADTGSVHDAQDVSAYDTQDVSAYDTQNVSACDAQDVSAYNAQEVSAYDTLDVSAYDAQEVSAYDTQYVSAYDTQDLSAYDTQDVSAYDAQDVSAYDTQDVSAYDTQDLSAYDTQEVSAYDTQDVPAYDAQDVSAYDAKDVPTYDTQDVPAYDAQDLSGYDVQDVPTYDTQDMPAYDIQDVPAHKKQDVSVFETQGISAYDAQYGVHVDDTDGVHVDDTDGVHVDDTGGVHADDTDDVHVDDTDGVHVDDTDGLHVDDTDGVHVDDTDGVHVDDTDGVHVDDTDGVHADDTDGVHVDDTGGVHVDDTDGVHVDDTDGVHVDDTDGVHVDDTDGVHVDDTDGVHANDTDGVHVDDTDGVHVDDTDGVHANDTDGVHADDTDGVHVDDTDGVHVDDTDCVHVDDTDGVHVDDTDGVHANDTDGVHADDTDGVHVDDTDGVHVDDTDGVHVDDADGVHVDHTDGVHVDDTDGVHVNDTDGVHADDTDGVHADDTDGVHVDDTDGVHVDDTDGVHVDDTDGTRHGATPDVNTNFATPRNIAGKTDDSDGSFENVDPAPSLIEYVTTSQNIGPETVPECATSKEAASTGLEEVPQSDIAGHGGVRAPASSPRYDDGVPVTDLDEDICDPDLSSPEVAPSSAPGELDIGEGSGPFESVLCPLAPEGEALAFDVYSSATRPVKASPWAQQMEDPSIRKRHYVEEEVLTEARVEVAAARNESSVLADTNWVTVAYFLCLSLVAAIVCVCAEGSVSMGWILSALALGCLILFAILKV